MAETKLDRLKANLATSDVAKKDQPLFQVISQLIDYLNSNTQQLSEVVEIVSPAGGGGSVVDKTYLTESDETDILTSSRMVVAGERIIFDDSIAGVRTENVPINEVILTGANESATLPNSRRLLAGTGISFDDSIANERTVSVPASALIDYVATTTGVEPAELLSDGFGNAIYIPYTP